MEVATRTAAALRLPNAMRDRLVAAAKALPEVSLAMDEPAVRATIYRHGGRAVADQYQDAPAAIPPSTRTRASASTE